MSKIIIKIDELKNIDHTGHPVKLIVSETLRNGVLCKCVTLISENNEFVHYYFIGNGEVDICTDINDHLQAGSVSHEDVRAYTGTLKEYTKPWQPIKLHMDDSDEFNDFATAVSSDAENNINKVTSFLSKYAYFMPMCIVGDPGSGKTYSAREFGEEAEYFIEVQCDPSLEPIDLRGGIVPSVDDEGRMTYVWRDGMLSQAFRRAQDGMKVVLLLDEILRINARERSVFLSSLSPDPQGNYVLKTGRVIKDDDGYDVEECLKAPKDKLTIIATTNSGAAFDIDRADPAFKDRFVFERHDSDISTVMTVVRSKTEDVTAIKAINLVYTGLMKFHVSGDLTGKPSLRHMCNVIDMVSHGVELKEALLRHVHIWAGEDRLTGDCIESERDIVDNIVDKALIKQE